jgi:hypothetical protein
MPTLRTIRGCSTESQRSRTRRAGCSSEPERATGTRACLRAGAVVDALALPSTSNFTPPRGACGKPRVVLDNRRPQAGIYGTGGEMRVCCCRRTGRAGGRTEVGTRGALTAGVTSAGAWR